jgi:hypothetical protein
MTVRETTDQHDHELIDQLNNARYASLTSRAVTDAARGIIDRLIEFLEGREEHRKSRKNSAARRLGLMYAERWKGL